MSNDAIKAKGEVKTVQKNVGTPLWKKEAKGIPVGEGLNWVTGLTHQQRVNAMLEHENYWKKKYNASKGGLQQNWTRG